MAEIIMRIGIVGCGLNAGYHINFARSYPDLVISGVVDKDVEIARQRLKRFGIEKTFQSIGEMVAEDKPDVIHIVTPPTTHFDLGREALEAGCHVVMESPLALNLGEAEKLYELAEQKGVRICPIHNHFFDPCMVKARTLMRSGEAGSIVNVESYYGLNTWIPAFRDYPRPNELPWLYSMPGGVFHNFLPHPLYLMLDYTGGPRDVKVAHRCYNTLPQGLPDEIRILIDGERAQGTLTVSTVAKPHLHFVRIYGTKMMVEVDINTMTTVSHSVSSFPKAAQKATYNLSSAWQLYRETTRNMFYFLTKKLKTYQGMKDQIHLFYDSLRSVRTMPVTREQALTVISTMDRIWETLKPKSLLFDPVVTVLSQEHEEKKRVLVTGGTGFLGKRLVKKLMMSGYRVRVLSRKLSDTKPIEKLGAEIFFGDVGHRDSYKAAMTDVDIVVHAAAGTSGSQRDSQVGTLDGTRNTLELCREEKVTKLVYISSCSVYGVSGYRRGSQVTEGFSLEKHPEKRGVYSSSKQAAEKMVTDSIIDAPYPVTVLRPGTIFGPEGNLYTPMLGLSAFDRLFIVFSRRGFTLPLVHVDNLVEAVLLCMENNAADGQIFNVVDPEKVTKKQYMNELIRKLYPRSFIIYFPYAALYLTTILQEIAFKLMKRNPILTTYRLASSQNPIQFDSSKLARTLNWKPEISFKEGVAEILDSKSSLE
jgi:predicted dehydrogenase/nucleoside-diphosphate-sugar epimerase